MSLLYHLASILLSEAKLFANRELTVLLSIAVGLGAAWTAHKLHISPALGAFVAGMLLGESPVATQIRADIVVDEEITMGDMLSRRIVEHLMDESGVLVACRLGGHIPE